MLHFKMQSIERSERKKFAKVRERLYNANTCLSNLIFLPLYSLFPVTFMKICMVFVRPRLCQDAGCVHASMEWTPLFVRYSLHSATDLSPTLNCRVESRRRCVRNSQLVRSSLDESEQICQQRTQLRRVGGVNAPVGSRYPACNFLCC